MGSIVGTAPISRSKEPPYCLGILSGDMNCERVGRTSASDRMKILLTVIGSNHRLIQDHTVGKNDGAPTIYICEKGYRDMRSRAHKDSIQCFWIMSCREDTRILHVVPQVPELFQADIGDIN